MSTLRVESPAYAPRQLRLQMCRPCGLRKRCTIHDVIAAALARSRKNVLEIGSRNGNGVSCFAQAAKAAAVVVSRAHLRIL